MIFLYGCFHFLNLFYLALLDFKKCFFDIVSFNRIILLLQFVLIIDFYKILILFKLMRFHFEACFNFIFGCYTIWFVGYCMIKFHVSWSYQTFYPILWIIMREFNWKHVYVYDCINLKREVYSTSPCHTPVTWTLHPTVVFRSNIFATNAFLQAFHIAIF